MKITRFTSLFMSASKFISAEAAATAAGAKAIIRDQIKVALKVLTSEEIEEKSTAIFRRLSDMSQYAESSSICLYLSMPAGEVRSYTLLQSAFDGSKRVFIPKVTGKNSADLKIFELESFNTINEFPRSKWGIPEPPKDFVERSVDATYLGLVDCVILPGVAFDSKCARIGHGKGYYDCFLERITAAHTAAGKSPPVTIGLAFDEQILEDGSIPMEVHDKVLDYVVTPTRVFSGMKELGSGIPDPGIWIHGPYEVLSR